MSYNFSKKAQLSWEAIHSSKLKLSCFAPSDRQAIPLQCNGKEYTAILPFTETFVPPTKALAIAAKLWLIKYHLENATAPGFDLALGRKSINPRHLSLGCPTNQVAMPELLLFCCRSTEPHHLYQFHSCCCCRYCCCIYFSSTVLWAMCNPKLCCWFSVSLGSQRTDIVPGTWLYLSGGDFSCIQ